MALQNPCFCRPAACLLTSGPKSPYNASVKAARRRGNRRLARFACRYRGFEAACAGLRRTTLQDNPRVEAIVREIIADVKARGDAALLELSRRFDAPELETLEVPRADWDAAEARITPELRA